MTKVTWRHFLHVREELKDMLHDVKNDVLFIHKSPYLAAVTHGEIRYCVRVSRVRDPCNLERKYKVQTFISWLHCRLCRMFLKYHKISDAAIPDPWPVVLPVLSSPLHHLLCQQYVTSRDENGSHQYSCRDYASGTEGCHWLCNCSPVVLSITVDARLSPCVALRGHITRKTNFNSSSLWEISVEDWNVKYSRHRKAKSTFWRPPGDCSSLFFCIEPTQY